MCRYARFDGARTDIVRGNRRKIVSIVGKTTVGPYGERNEHGASALAEQREIFKIYRPNALATSGTLMGRRGTAVVTFTTSAHRVSDACGRTAGGHDRVLAHPATIATYQHDSARLGRGRQGGVSQHHRTNSVIAPSPRIEQSRFTLAVPQQREDAAIDLK